jgi:hypothetical protein
MSTPAEMQERHGAMLAELAELGLSLARDLHAAALAAETPAERQGLATAFHRISRSVRQTMALEAKLERDARRAEREDPQFARKAAEQRREAEARENAIRHRRDTLWDILEPLIWD